MPWFKVDDGLHAHRKVIRAGIPAMGLWVVAGSWCSDQLSDGFIPDYVAQRLDPDFKEHAAALVAAKLWIPGEKDDETGWWFHQWSDEGRQPTAESVIAKRDDARERMAKLRAERSEASKNKTNGSQDVRANTSGTSQEVASTPTRPDPTLIKEPSSASPPPLAPLAESEPTTSKPTTRRRKTDPPPEHPRFAEFWDAYPRHDAKLKAREAFTKAVEAGANPAAVIKGAAAFAQVCVQRRTEKHHMPLPTTWLNGQRWNDEHDGRVTPGNDRPLPPHCGLCDLPDRTIELPNGSLVRCPDCHPDAERNRR